ncbi:MAG: exo-beta-N-acetylmuramidase NamZ domain-containing protein, partial [Candidatus Acidiferrales bacterium]
MRRLKAVAVLVALVLLVFLLRGNRWWPPPPTRVAPVQTGIDVLAADDFALLAGKRVGLITNQTGRTRDGRRTVDLLAAPGVELAALFSPEHGMEGVRTGRVEDGADSATGLRVYSLYGQTRRP